MILYKMLMEIHTHINNVSKRNMAISSLIFMNNKYFEVTIPIHENMSDLFRYFTIEIQYKKLFKASFCPFKFKITIDFDDCIFDNIIYMSMTQHVFTNKVVFNKTFVKYLIYKMYRDLNESRRINYNDYV